MSLKSLWFRTKYSLEVLRRDPESWRLFARALRYRIDGNALRFTVQTLKPLAAPPKDAKRVVLFAHYDPQDQVDPYVVKYVRALKELQCAVIFVSGSPALSAASAAPLQSCCEGIFTQKTLAMDFGSWNLAWQHMERAGWKIEQFEQVILANDSVYGPLYRLTEMFDSFQGADIYGVTENFEITRHLQSYFLVFAMNAKTASFLKRFWRGFRYIIAKRILIEECEVGLSRRAIAEGLVLKPYIPETRVREEMSRDQGHPQQSAVLEGTVNPTLYVWDVLVSRLRCPFLKTDVVKNNRYDSPLVGELNRFLPAHSDYPVELIVNHVTRLRSGAQTERRSSHQESQSRQDD